MWREARVKALAVQPNGTLWIGTRDGFILLVDKSTHQLVQNINSGCHSVRNMASLFTGNAMCFFFVFTKYCLTLTNTVWIL